MSENIYIKFISNGDVKRTLRKFCNKFTKIFSIAQDGSIRVDNETLIELNKWILDENTNLLIFSLSGTRLKESDIPHIGNSFAKYKLLRVYIVCCTAYLKASNICRIQIDHTRYNNINEVNIDFI